MDDSHSRAAHDGSSNAGGSYKPLFLMDREWAFFIDRLQLSQREAAITSFLLAGLSERQMAQNLGISSHTVHSYLERLYRKLHVRSRCAVVATLLRELAELYYRQHTDQEQMSSEPGSKPVAAQDSANGAVSATLLEPSALATVPRSAVALSRSRMRCEK